MKKRNILILILLMVIGFAAVTTTLVINGRIKVAFHQKEFDVYYSDAFVNGVNDKTVIKADKKIEFSADMTLIDEVYELEYFVTNGSRNYDAELTINCTESNEYLTITNDFENGTVLPATETTEGNKLTVTVAKAYAGTEEEPTKDFSILCEIVAIPVVRENQATGTPANKVKHQNGLTYEDIDNNGELSIGDLITIGTESFHVYKIDEENVKAISQYNLYVGGSMDTSTWTYLPYGDEATGIQDSEMKGSVAGESVYNGTLAYSDDEKHGIDYSSYNGSIVKDYVDNYVDILYTKYNIEVRGSLITKEELEEIIGDGKLYSGTPLTGYTDIPEWICGTSYWTGSPMSNDSAMAIDTDGLVNLDGYLENNGTYGVRPVIELSKSLFE